MSRGTLDANPKAGPISTPTGFVEAKVLRAVRGRRHRLSFQFLLYRFRYLVTFILIGMTSVGLEVVLVGTLLNTPAIPSWHARAAIAFLFGLALSFVLNATVNFHVPRRLLLQTFLLFGAVSTLSFSLNLAMASLITSLTHGPVYGEIRLVTSALVFALSYWLHRRFTFRTAKNYGLAVYASATEDVSRIHQRVGDNCDHVHIDLVDNTRRPDAPDVDLSKISEARALWGNRPFCLHVMSTDPRAWIEKTWDLIDWFIIDIDAEDDVIDVLWRCKLRGKKTGVVWHQSTEHRALLHYLPHVDFVLVLGIEQPGKSGQKINPEAVRIARLLDELRPKYDFEIIFDGGVTLANVRDLPVKYVVAASAVIDADNPVLAAYRLMTGSRYEKANV